jgi:hypothetical protein
VEQIIRNIKLLERKLADFDLQASYDLATKIKYEIVGLGEEVSSFAPEQDKKNNLFCKVDGYIDGGIVRLEIGKELPHAKAELSAAGHEYWLKLIHTAIAELAEKFTIPKLEKAFVGIFTAMPKGYNNTKIWDVSNRAINLILNNLKGIFFSDDDIEHMAFSIVGSWSAEPKAIIFIGDFNSQSAKIMEKLILVKDENMLF